MNNLFNRGENIVDVPRSVLSINDAITLIMNIRRCLFVGGIVPPLKRTSAEGTCPSTRLS